MQERPKPEYEMKKISPPKKKLVENSPPGTREEDHEASVEAPTYDFEKMIEEAMKKAGQSGGMGGPSPRKNPKKESANQEDDEAQPIVSKEKQKKAELLAKRKKYDPRAALKEAKQKEQENALHEDPAAEKPDVLSRLAQHAMEKSANKTPRQPAQMDDEYPNPELEDEHGLVTPDQE